MTDVIRNRSYWSPHTVCDRHARPAYHAADSPAGSSDARDALARERDQAADERDNEATLRDLLAASADAEIDAAERDEGLGDCGSTDHSLIFHAARDRERAAADRAGASAQRAAAARDREHARRDRQIAAADRHHAAVERAATGADDLTGALRRGVGLISLQREIERARRTDEPLVLAFVDVDGLKRVNDTLGHGEGDELLKRVADLIGAHLRPYDVTVRVGGDEFVCSLSGVGGEEVARRFHQIGADLAATPGGGSISVGLAVLKAEDSLDDLIGRADAALIAKRGSGGTHARRFERRG